MLRIKAFSYKEKKLVLYKVVEFQLVYVDKSVLPRKDSFAKRGSGVMSVINRFLQRIVLKDILLLKTWLIDIGRQCFIKTLTLWFIILKLNGWMCGELSDILITSIYYMATAFFPTPSCN